MKRTAANPVGAPSSFTQARADKICERLMCGESLRAICADEGMPKQSTVFAWINAHPHFHEQYARARDVQADVLADEIISLSDNSRIGKKTTEKPDGSIEIVTADMVERTRLQIDARKWFAGKIAPKKYGDKLDLNHSGAVGVTVKAEDLTDDELAARIRCAEQAAGK